MSLMSRVLLLLAPRRRVRLAFTRHYQRRDWDEPETVSGRGSSLRSTIAIRRELPRLLVDFGVRSVVDAGCGDFYWLSTLQLDLDSYLGLEVVEGLAATNQARYGNEQRRFAALDLIRDPLPRADLILSRDCLVHLKNRQVSAALRNFRRSGSRFLLATTFTNVQRNEDVPLGGWRPLNLEAHPFNLGTPLVAISEAESVEDSRYTDKSLALWRLSPSPRR